MVLGFSIPATFSRDEYFNYVAECTLALQSNDSVVLKESEWCISAEKCESRFARVAAWWGGGGGSVAHAKMHCDPYCDHLAPHPTVENNRRHLGHVLRHNRPRLGLVPLDGVHLLALAAGTPVPERHTVLVCYRWPRFAWRCTCGAPYPPYPPFESIHPAPSSVAGRSTLY